jgi:hypothetical protein
MRIGLLMLAMVTSILSAAETALPSAAVTALEKLDKIEGKLTAEYKKSVVAQRSKTIEELEKVVKEVTKTGNLELALAVKAKVDELVAKNEAENDPDLLGNKKPITLDPAKLVIGMWDFEQTNTIKGTIEFMPSGNFIGSMIAPEVHPFIPGKWEIKDDQVILRWSYKKPEQIDILTFTAMDKMVGEAFDLGKNSITATKKVAK